MSSRCYAMTHPCRKCRKGTLSLLATCSDHAGINLVTMAPSHSPQRGQEPRWPNPLRSLTFLCQTKRQMKSLCTVVPDERASSQAGRCTKLAQKGCKEKGRNTKGTPKEHQRNTKGTPKEHQRNTKGTPKEHQRIWLETSEILRQGVEAAISVKPLSQVDPKDLKLLGVGALVVPLLQPAACCSLPVTWCINMSVSENRLVPLNPMVLLIIIPMKNGYFIGNIPHFQTNPNMV